jgi:hypothetical protein
MRRHVAETPDRTPVMTQMQRDLDRLVPQFNAVRELRDGWNGDEAQAPNEAAIMAAAYLIALACVCGFAPDTVAAFVDEEMRGGVRLTWGRGERYACVECDNSGNVTAFLSGSEPIIETWALTLGNFAEYVDSLGEIRKFLEDEE